MRSLRRFAGQRGATAVLVAVLLVVLVAMLGLTLNAGHLLSVRGETQNAVDAAAFGGARRLDGTPERLASATQFAEAFALRHDTDGQDPVVLTAAGPNAAPVVFGTWDRATKTFTPVTIPAGASAATQNLLARQINAVRATSQKQEAYYLNTFLSADAEGDVGAMATATAGGPCQASCDTAPLVIRQGCLLDEEAGLRCGQDYVLGLSPAPDDSAGLTDLVPFGVVTNNASANSSDICDALRDDPPEGCVIEANKSFLHTTNGNQLSANCDDAATNRVREKICNWFKQWAPVEGEPLKQITIPLVEYVQESGDPYACDGQYGGVAQVNGFAAFEVTGVYCLHETDNRTGPCAMFATSQCMSVRYVCGVTPPGTGGPAGCGWWGATPVPPTLVQ